MTKEIIEALREFDPLDDDQWTTDGAPKMEAVHLLTGDDTITRKDVVEAAPKFNRETPIEEEEEEEDDAEEEDSEVREDPEVEDLQEKYDELTETMAEETRLSDLHKKRAEEARVSAKMIMNRIRALEPSMTNDQSIRAYIDSQNAARMERAKGRAVVLRHLKVEDIDPRSALDRAMARKNSRGAQRPTR